MFIRTYVHVYVYRKERMPKWLLHQTDQSYTTVSWLLVKLKCNYLNYILSMCYTGIVCIPYEVCMWSSLSPVYCVLQTYVTYMHVHAHIHTCYTHTSSDASFTTISSLCDNTKLFLVIIKNYLMDISSAYLCTYLVY